MQPHWRFGFIYFCTIMQKHIINATCKLGAGYTHADKLDSGTELNYGGGRVGAGGIDLGLYRSTQEAQNG